MDAINVEDPAKPWLRTHTLDGQVVREDRRKPEMQANGAYVLRDPKTGVAYNTSTGEELPGT